MSADEIPGETLEACRVKRFIKARSPANSLPLFVPSYLATMLFKTFVFALAFVPSFIAAQDDMFPEGGPVKVLIGTKDFKETLKEEVCSDIPAIRYRGALVSLLFCPAVGYCSLLRAVVRALQEPEARIQ